MGSLGIVAALDALPKLVDLADKLTSAKDEASRNQLLIEFQRAVIQAQSESMSLSAQLRGLRDEVDSLYGQLATLRNWEAESANFHRLQIQNGVFVVERNGSTGQYRNRETYCTHCFSNSKLSLLQYRATGMRRGSLVCPACTHVVEFSHYVDEEPGFDPANPFGHRKQP
jgi:hypothetical protein